MRQSERYAVAPGAALLYDFVNSLDERRYVVDHMRLEGSDAIGTLPKFESWLRDHGLSDHADNNGWRQAMVLRDGLRSYLKAEPAAREGLTAGMEAAASAYPLSLIADPTGRICLAPQAGQHTLGLVLVQLHALSQFGQLDRLKACADPECRWVFLDRSKPGSRRWCSSTGCGNRQKTRAYRARQTGLD